MAINTETHKWPMLQRIRDLGYSALKRMSISHHSTQASGIYIGRRGRKTVEPEMVSNFQRTVSLTQQGRCTYKHREWEIMTVCPRPAQVQARQNPFVKKGWTHYLSKKLYRTFTLQSLILQSLTISDLKDDFTCSLVENKSHPSLPLDGQTLAKRCSTVFQYFSSMPSIQNLTITFVRC